MTPASVEMTLGMHRLPGSDKTSERWTKAMEGAQEGVIAKLRILSMDVVMATSDGSDRWFSSLKCLCQAQDGLHMIHASLFQAQASTPPLAPRWIMLSPRFSH